MMMSVEPVRTMMMLMRKLGNWEVGTTVIYDDIDADEVSRCPLA